MNLLQFRIPANRSTFPVLAVLLAMAVLAATHLSPSLTPSAAAGPASLAAGSRIAWQGGSWYLHGANVPWYNWACDFGCGANGGVSSPSVATALGATFAQAQSSGVRVLRWWTFEGNPWQVTRDASGVPTGLNPSVYADFDAALQLAEQYDLYYDFVLFSGPSSLPPAWLSDASQRTKLVSALTPLFARYNGHPRVLSWEVFNEPDFDVWNGKVTLANLRATVQAVADAVHTNSTAYVTVGMGFADGLPMVQGLGLDYYQAHWYDYMSGGTYCMRCNSYSFYQSKFGLDAPLVVGEYYSSTGADALQRLEDFYAKGYAGAWAWSLFWDRTNDKMKVDLAAAATFSGRHADLGPKSGSAPPPPTTITPTPTAPATSTPTATVTSTPGATASPTATTTSTPSPTLTATPAQPCSPRPPVSVSTIRRGAARLEVTVAVSSNEGTPGNWLRALDFGNATNARIIAGNQSGTGNFSVSFPSGTRQVTFEVRRLQSGKDMVVPFTAVDACGAWQTFVGDGARGS